LQEAHVAGTFRNRRFATACHIATVAGAALTGRLKLMLTDQDYARCQDNTVKCAIYLSKTFIFEIITPVIHFNFGCLMS